jgi:hypothetical protein
MRYVFAVLLVLAILSGVLLAQSGSANETIDECTEAQGKIIFVALSEGDFLEKYGAVYTALQEDGWTEQAQELLETTFALRQSYYIDVQPSLPDCAGSVRLQMAVTDALSQQIILLSALNLINADNQAYAYFGESAEDLGSRFATMNQQLLSVLQEMLEVAGVEESDE